MIQRICGLFVAFNATTVLVAQLVATDEVSWLYFLNVGLLFLGCALFSHTLPTRDQ